jgi:hypothetical protein
MNKDKQKVVSERKKRTRQQSLEVSSFAVLATVKAKKKKEEEEVGEHAQAEGGSVSSKLANVKDIKTSTPAVVRLKQSNLASWATNITSDAGQRRDDHTEKVKEARKERKKKKDKEKKKKKRKPEDEAIRAEESKARWQDRAERQDEAANREGKIISFAETRSGRKRKVTSSAY